MLIFDIQEKYKLKIFTRNEINLMYQNLENIIQNSINDEYKNILFITYKNFFLLNLSFYQDIVIDEIPIIIRFLSKLNKEDILVLSQFWLYIKQNLMFLNNLQSEYFTNRILVIELLNSLQEFLDQNKQYINDFYFGTQKTKNEN